MLAALTAKKFRNASENTINSTTVNTRNGINNSFMCSQVDSLTAENTAITRFPPVHSYTKCSSVPKRPVAIKPTISHRRSSRFMLRPPFPPRSSRASTIVYAGKKGFIQQKPP